MRRCAIVRQYVSLDKFREANGTITLISLRDNKIGDEGAVALADSLKATLVTCVLQFRASLFFCVAVLLASLRAHGTLCVDVHVYACVDSRGRTSNFLSITAGVHAKLSFACPTHVINVSRTGHCERHRAIGTGSQEFCRKIDVYIQRYTVVRIGSERCPWASKERWKCTQALF